MHFTAPARWPFARVKCATRPSVSSPKRWELSNIYKPRTPFDTAHPAPLPHVAFCGESPPHLGIQGIALDFGTHPHRDAKARRGRTDRRVSKDSDPANRRRHLLRHGTDRRRDRRVAADADAVPEGGGGIAYGRPMGRLDALLDGGCLHHAARGP